ncbi:MAG: 2OG-Fe(II) oxygenase, partial [Nanoarchaeota archaeon]|nr:2OG-Fe(II) oxygenase [Nanoarchaeota archaeon]
DLFKFGQTHDFHYCKSKKLKAFHKSCLTWDFLNLIEEITNVKFKGTLSMSASLYKKTNFLLPHDDKLEDRKITYLYYLSDLNKKEGGGFNIYKTKNNLPTKIEKTLQPEFNSLLLFKVQKNSFHEVAEILSDKPRYTIGGWIA